MQQYTTDDGKLTLQYVGKLSSISKFKIDDLDHEFIVARDVSDKFYFIVEHNSNTIRFDNIKNGNSYSDIIDGINIQVLPTISNNLFLDITITEI